MLFFSAFAAFVACFDVFVLVFDVKMFPVFHVLAGKARTSSFLL